MAQWTVNRLVRIGAGSAPGRFALRVARDLGDLELFDRGMTLAAHAFTSVLPILIVAGALRAELAPVDGAILAEHLGLNHATAEILERSLPGGAQELAATGVVGILLLVIAATSFARALERCFRRIWRTPRVGVRFAWRWLLAILAVLIGIALIVMTRTVLRGGGAMPVVEFILEAAVWSALWWWTSWIVINRSVRLIELLPGSVLAGIGFAAAGALGRVVLPEILATSAQRFGVLGMAFSYVGWLFSLMCVLLIAATVGRVVRLTVSGQAWRRSVALPRAEATVLGGRSAPLGGGEAGNATTRT
ncbi:YhjD/YihY/BrkB family envelope integrity protein [Agromyces mariniharenae]|uniref:YihY/virulence factor BrkB family protein n=1 Tax=Agromyces mariniharenae TaxID=2604423 RepID=A0A5S4V256_9MICO|nr:YhjD/YihY/BrkB family envelope integrity protein [Agromyces mariniharenae]TYL53217.1 hypothetical protein FYC51_05850 [Agromyces mariniharenae]